jgi:hypothetical protein
MDENTGQLSHPDDLPSRTMSLSTVFRSLRNTKANFPGKYMEHCLGISSEVIVLRGSSSVPFYASRFIKNGIITLLQTSIEFCSLTFHL